MMTMGKCELFQKLQQEDTGFIWKPTWKGNKKTIAYYKLKKKKKKNQTNATAPETNCLSELL